MPAYARDGKIVCFFQSAAKFKTRYATLGFSDQAKLDEGAMWPATFALKELTVPEEARIDGLVKKMAFQTSGRPIRFRSSFILRSRSGVMQILSISQ